MQFKMNAHIQISTKVCLWMSCSSGWVAARGVIQVIQLYVQKANKSKLNTVSLVTILQCWLCVDSHHTANSPAAVTPTSLDWSLDASVLASLAKLVWMEYRVPFHSNSVFFPFFWTFICTCCYDFFFKNLYYTCYKGHLHTWELPHSTTAF